MRLAPFHRIGAVNRLFYCAESAVLESAHSTAALRRGIIERDYCAMPAELSGVAADLHAPIAQNLNEAHEYLLHDVFALVFVPAALRGKLSKWHSR